MHHKNNIFDYAIECTVLLLQAIDDSLKEVRKNEEEE